MLPENVIPEGVYCYKIKSIEKDENNLPIIKTELCPYWFRNKLGYGDCKYLIDYHRSIGLTEEFNGEVEGHFDILLHDQCKVCGINEPDWEELENEDEHYEETLKNIEKEQKIKKEII